MSGAAQVHQEREGRGGDCRYGFFGDCGCGADGDPGDHAGVLDGQARVRSSSGENPRGLGAGDVHAGPPVRIEAGSADGRVGAPRPDHRSGRGHRQGAAPEWRGDGPYRDEGCE